MESGIFGFLVRNLSDWAKKITSYLNLKEVAKWIKMSHFCFQLMLSKKSKTRNKTNLRSDQWEDLMLHCIGGCLYDVKISLGASNFDECQILIQALKYLKSALRKIWRLASNIYAWYQIFDAVCVIFNCEHQNLMSLVKFWRHKCVPPLCHDLCSTKVILRTRKFIDVNGKDRCMFTDLQSVRNVLGFGGAVCRGFASVFVVFSHPLVGADSEMVSDGLVFVGDEIVSSHKGSPVIVKRRNFLPCSSCVAKVQGNGEVRARPSNGQ